MSSLEKIVVLKLNDNRNVFSARSTKEIKDEVRKQIGAEFRPGTTDTIRGLDYVQELVIMPNKLGLQPNDIAFIDKLRDFWSDFEIKPTVEGLKLNIATREMEVDVNGKKEKVEIPVNIEDYMKYRFAMQSQKVAKTKEELDNLADFDFYLVDLSAEQERKENAFLVSKEAKIVLAKLLVNLEKDEAAVEKVDWILQMLTPEGEYFDKDIRTIDKEMLLEEKASSNPSKFVEVVKDPDLETKALMAKAIALSIIKVEGKDYFYGNKNIGTYKSAVSYLSNPENSGDRLAIQSRIEATAQITRKPSV